MGPFLGNFQISLRHEKTFVLPNMRNFLKNPHNFFNQLTSSNIKAILIIKYLL